MGDATFERFLAHHEEYQITGFHPDAGVCQQLNTLPERTRYRGQCTVRPDFNPEQGSFDVGLALETVEHLNDTEMAEVLGGLGVHAS